MARNSPRHAARSKVPFPVLVLALLLGVGAVTAWRVWGSDAGGRASKADPSAQPSTGASPSTVPSASPASPSPRSPSPGVQTPGPINTAFPGITTFRGNATRDYYGEGPIPRHPVIRWSYPTSGALCSSSTDPARNARLVRDRVDRAAERDRAR